MSGFALTFCLFGVSLFLISMLTGLVGVNDGMNLFIGAHALTPSNATASLGSGKLTENATATLGSGKLTENATATLGSGKLTENATASIVPGTGLMNSQLNEKKT